MFKQFYYLLNEKEKIRGLVESRIRTYGNDRALGILWWFLDPLLIIYTYKLIIVDVLERGGDDYPLFIACAVIPWRWFTVASCSAGNSILAQAGLLKATGVPRILIPFSEILVASINFFYSIFVFGFFMWWYNFPPTLYLLYLPLIILVQFLYIFAFGIILSNLQIYFRDFINVWQFILRLWFYLSPSLYALDQVPEKFSAFFQINPFSHIFHAYRQIILRGSHPNLENLLLTTIGGIIFLFLASYYFSRNENKVMRII